MACLEHHTLYGSSIRMLGHTVALVVGLGACAALLAQLVFSDLLWCCGSPWRTWSRMCRCCALLPTRGRVGGAGACVAQAGRAPAGRQSSAKQMPRGRLSGRRRASVGGSLLWRGSGKAAGLRQSDCVDARCEFERGLELLEGLELAHVWVGFARAVQDRNAFLLVLKEMLQTATSCLCFWSGRRQHCVAVCDMRWEGASPALPQLLGSVASLVGHGPAAAAISAKHSGRHGVCSFQAPAEAVRRCFAE